MAVAKLAVEAASAAYFRIAWCSCGRLSYLVLLKMISKYSVA